MTTYFNHGYALLIGVDDNQVKNLQLSVVGKDLAALRQVLVNPDYCAYPDSDDHIRVIRGESATRKAMFEGFKWLKSRLDNDSSDKATAVVYYSGHGWRDSKSHKPHFYLIPYDIDPDDPRCSAMAATDFAAKIAELAPRRLFVALDCCHAAGMGAKGGELNGENLAPGHYIDAQIPLAPILADYLSGDSSGDWPADSSGDSSAEGQKGLDMLVRGHGRAVLVSCQPEEKSWIRKDETMSIFTYHLIEALTGHAKPENGAREVLVSDIESHLQRTVNNSARAEWRQPQNPDFTKTGGFAVAMLRGGKSWNGAVDSPPDPLAITTREPAREPTTPGSVTQIGGAGSILVGGTVRGSNFTVGNNNQVDDNSIHIGSVSSGGGDMSIGNRNGNR